MAKTKESKVVKEQPKSTSSSKTKTTTKAVAKEAPKKEVKAKPALEKVEVSYKQIGKNLNVVLGNEKFTRVGTKEELEVVKELAKAYDAKPTKANMEALMKSVKPETAKVEKQEADLKAEVKATKKKVQEKEQELKKKKVDVSEVVAEIDDKLMSTEELDKMEAAIKRQREKIAPVAKTTPTPSAPRTRERY